MNRKSMKKKWVIFILFLGIILPTMNAADFDHVISNSEKWTDVYSSIHYANLRGVGSDFLVSTGHGPVLLDGISKSNRIMVISSDDRPYVFNYQDMIRAKEFAGVEEINSDNLNLELAKELNEINKYVVVGDSFGYNSLAVAPYAVKTKSWVFFANKDNIYEIDNFLSQKNVGNILIYGFVDPIVTETLSKYNPKIISKGDRFEDNIEIVKEYLKIFPTTQVILTNGEFIEKEIMSGAEPVLFTGKENVPPKISDYLKQSSIEIGVLIGNDLVGAAQNIKESSGIYVMVKFARSARVPEGGISAVEGLDLFPVPTPNMLLTIHSVKYNQALSQLEITYLSKSNIPIYLKGTITVEADGDRKKQGDEDPIFIAPGDYKTIIYPWEINSPQGAIAEIYTLYGETEVALEKILQATLNIESINVIDACQLSTEDIKSVKYSTQKEGIIVKIKNPHDQECWVDLEVINLLIGSAQSKKTIGLEGSLRITPKKTKNIFIAQELTDQDLENNEYVNLRILSGEREDSLVHILEGKFKLEIESLAILTYAIIGLCILIVALIIIIVVIKKRQDKNEDYY